MKRSAHFFEAASPYYGRATKHPNPIDGGSWANNYDDSDRIARGQLNTASVAGLKLPKKSTLGRNKDVAIP